MTFVVERLDDLVVRAFVLDEERTPDSTAVGVDDVEERTVLLDVGDVNAVFKGDHDYLGHLRYLRKKERVTNDVDFVLEYTLVYLLSLNVHMPI